MWIVAVVGAIGVLIGVWRFVMRPRVGVPASGLRRLLLARAIADAGAWTSGGALFLLSAFGGAARDGLRIALLMACLVSAGVVWCTGRVRAAMERADVYGVSRLLRLRTDTTTRRLGSWVRHRVKIIAPTWSEIHIEPATLDRAFAPRTVFLGYFAGLAISPILFAVLLMGSLRSLPTLEQRVLTTILGYNALTVASCLTAAILLTFTLLVVSRHLHILQVSLDLKAAFRTIATAAGYGTAAGFVTAALLPVTNRFAPFAISESASAPNLAEVFSPRLLIDIPAAGAVFGYGVGLLLATIIVCKEAENLLVRRLLTPVVFVAILTALGAAGIDPRGLMESIVSGLSDSTAPAIDCTDDSALEQRIENGASILHVLIQCNVPIMLDRWVFLGTIAALAALCALLAIARDVGQVLDREYKGSCRSGADEPGEDPAVER